NAFGKLDVTLGRLVLDLLNEGGKDTPGQGALFLRSGLVVTEADGDEVCHLSLSVLRVDKHTGDLDFFAVKVVHRKRDVSECAVFKVGRFAVLRHWVFPAVLALFGCAEVDLNVLG